jgi:hypothetical protein
MMTVVTLDYVTNVDCSVWGTPCAPTQMASLQPVASGSYVATFGVATRANRGFGQCTGRRELS